MAFLMSAPTRPVWAATDLLEATGGRFGVPFDASGVSIDTRTIQPGDLFIALLSESGDGHDHAARAIEAGAAGVMLHRDNPDIANRLIVDDSLAGLTRLGAFARKRFPGRVVAVTGSVGKTTTKEMLRIALAPFGPVHAAVASYNNHWGVPLTLARSPLATPARSPLATPARSPRHDTARSPRDPFCIIEIGMNHAGEIAPLARLAHPHVAVITTIEAAHIGHLGGLEAIAEEKSSILQGLDHGGVAVLPADSPWFPLLRDRAGPHHVIGFGAAPGAAARLLGIEQNADYSNLLVDVDGRELRLRLSAPGRHMAMNAVATLAAVVALGLDPATAAHALEGFAPLPGRGAHRRLPLPGGPALLLDESYNANGASMRAALDVLRLQPAARRIAILGDMLELGESGPAEHAALAADVIRSADWLFTCGPLMRHLYESVPVAHRGCHAEDSTALAPLVAARVAAGDAVLVKGSLGSRMKTVVAALDDLTRVTPPGARADVASPDARADVASPDARADAAPPGRPNDIAPPGAPADVAPPDARADVASPDAPNRDAASAARNDIAMTAASARVLGGRA
jgi:UDP-N-acetylmuramoyl-tripeptide--D-alanyl-D-alanine ligase